MPTRTPSQYNQPASGRKFTSTKGAPTGTPSGPKAALPQEKPKGRMGQGAYGAKQKHTAGFPHVKAYISGDY